MPLSHGWLEPRGVIRRADARLGGVAPSSLVFEYGADHDGYGMYDMRMEIVTLANLRDELAGMPLCEHGSE